MRINDWIRHRSATSARTAMRGVVVCYATAAEDDGGHESATRTFIAERLAALKGFDYAGDYDPAEVYDAPLYFVPRDTLRAEVAHALGIQGPADLFGGVVPHPFVSTKSITHPLASPGARAPQGWSREFERLTADCVLHGYTAFSREDAQTAGERLIGRGAVRVKPSLAVGGRGQTVVNDRAELAVALAAIDEHELATCGVVIERNLESVMTYSVGQVQVAGLIATYFGTQKLARDESGVEVYGGSDLMVARGDFDALLTLHVDDTARDAIERARLYDAAANACFPGFFASRRNYDVARGDDGHGRVRCGVLEQSWRIGGASAAELAALEAFHANASLRAVRAECTEVYGREAQPPQGAAVYFRGDDPKVGFITKYSTIEPYVDA